MGLGMLLKMTRCDDLGLGQLLFPDSTSDYAYEDSRESSYEHEQVVNHDLNPEFIRERDDPPDSDSDYGSELSECGSDCSCRYAKGKYDKYHDEEIEVERGRKRTRG